MRVSAQHIVTEAASKGAHVRQNLPAMFIATPLDRIGADKVFILISFDAVSD